MIGVKLKIKKNLDAHERFRKEFIERCPKELIIKLDELIQKNIFLGEE
jgi:hypothetical protein